MGDSFITFTFSISSLPIVLDLSMAGLGLWFDDLKESLLKVFLNNPTPGDMGLFMLGLGGTSADRLSWGISDATVISFSRS